MIAFTFPLLFSIFGDFDSTPFEIKIEESE